MLLRRCPDSATKWLTTGEHKIDYCSIWTQDAFPLNAFTQQRWHREPKRCETFGGLRWIQVVRKFGLMPGETNTQRWFDRIFFTHELSHSCSANVFATIVDEQTQLGWRLSPPAVAMTKRTWHAPDLSNDGTSYASAWQICVKLDGTPISKQISAIILYVYIYIYAFINDI